MQHAQNELVVAVCNARQGHLLEAPNETEDQRLPRFGEKIPKHAGGFGLSADVLSARERPGDNQTRRSNALPQQRVGWLVCGPQADLGTKNGSLVWTSLPGRGGFGNERFYLGGSGATALRFV